MQRVYIADSLAEGQLLVDLLLQHDIAAEMFHQNAQGGLGELAVTWPEVWIKSDMDSERARLLADEFENRPSPTYLLCCPECNESNPDNFEICWQCSAPLSRVSV